MANEIKNQNVDKWALDVFRKIDTENNLENVYFSSQRKLLHLKREMKKKSTRHKPGFPDY